MPKWYFITDIGMMYQIKFRSIIIERFLLRREKHIVANFNNCIAKKQIALAIITMAFIAVLLNRHLPLAVRYDFITMRL